MPETGSQSALEALAWQVAMGADEAISDAPVNRFEVSAAKPTRRKPAVETRAEPAAPRPGSAPAQANINLQSGVTDAEAIAQACGSLAELEEAVRAFEGCGLKKTAMNTVFADGNPQAPVMIIGEAPGADEDRQGKPFVGVSGQLMDRMMAAAGLTRDENLYITNILPWRPPGNRKPNPQEIALCLPFIRRHIELKAPKVVAFAGGTSAAALLETTQGITRLRGRWAELRVADATFPAMPMLHPAFLLRQPAMKGQAWRDILEMRARLK